MKLINNKERNENVAESLTMPPNKWQQFVKHQALQPIFTRYCTHASSIFPFLPFVPVIEWHHGEKEPLLLSIFRGWLSRIAIAQLKIYICFNCILCCLLGKVISLIFIRCHHTTHRHSPPWSIAFANFSFLTNIYMLFRFNIFLNRSQFGIYRSSWNVSSIVWIEHCISIRL